MRSGIGRLAEARIFWMKILLATGIYPPDIGGPATYVERLGRELCQRGMRVVVVTYSAKDDGQGTPLHTSGFEGQATDDGVEIVSVAKSGGPLLRWNRYTKALKEHGADADLIYVFSTVSAGVPLAMAGLKKPVQILRLGGDFLWERYTGLGGKMSLRAFYGRYVRLRHLLQWVLRQFDHIVFSTEFQQRIYERAYRSLPARSVIQNALPEGEPMMHQRHEPLRMLFLGRFVGFKNLQRLLRAARLLPHVSLTLIGAGPLQKSLQQTVDKLGLGGRVSFRASVHGADKQQALQDHDLLVLPSFTEISPHAAIEARAAGLPVLLTEETGLSTELTEGMSVRPLKTVTDITRAVLEVEQNYEAIAQAAAAPFRYRRTWEELVAEHMMLFGELLSGQR
ncbi:MAG: group 1 glycosyl transferase [Candidatus Peregrinibacteria bacterium Greene0416_19]|nr:MAG: group 1 glycosyl transferase [Candidatus Peregrinibacteria bacterium Greene0416_19]